MNQMSMFPTRGETFDEGRQEFNRKLQDDGFATCPCCERDAIVSKLKIHATLAYMLCCLYRVSMEKTGMPNEFVHLSEFKDSTISGNDFSIVKHWHLAQPMPADYMEDKRSSGMWRLTPHGIGWIRNQYTIERNKFVFDNRVIKSSIDQHVSIIEALNDKFSYHDSIGVPNRETAAA